MLKTAMVNIVLFHNAAHSPVTTWHRYNKTMVGNCVDIISSLVSLEHRLFILSGWSFDVRVFSFVAAEVTFLNDVVKVVIYMSLSLRSDEDR
jgi:hypothetical protein